MNTVLKTSDESFPTFNCSKYYLFQAKPK